jgi:hypothetical protein
VCPHEKFVADDAYISSEKGMSGARLLIGSSQLISLNLPGRKSH